MITEDYCSYEVAMMLKEKGFDEPCDNYYDQSSDEPQQLTLDEMYYSYDEFLKAPTHQMAIKWLREEYEISIEISALNRYHWVYTIYKILDNKVKELYNDGEFKSHEEAVEASLKYCLEKLI